MSQKRSKAQRRDYEEYIPPRKSEKKNKQSVNYDCTNIGVCGGPCPKGCPGYRRSK